MRTIEDTVDTFPSDIKAAANRVAYGADSGELIEAAARVWLSEYTPREIPGCSNGANQCAIFVPAGAR